AHAVDADEQILEDERHAIDAATIAIGPPALDFGHESVDLEQHRAGDAIEHGILVVGYFGFDTYPASETPSHGHAGPTLQCHWSCRSGDVPIAVEIGEAGVTGLRTYAASAV